MISEPPTSPASLLTGHFTRTWRRSRIASTTHLSFTTADCALHPHFTGAAAAFEQLSHLTLAASPHNTPAALQAYLGRNLRAWRFHGGALSDDFLRTLARTCRGLREVVVEDAYEAPADADGWVDALTGAGLLRMRRLRALVLGAGVVREDVLYRIVTGLPELARLEVATVVTRALVKGAAGAGAPVLPKLRDLTCTAEAAGLLALLEHLPKLRKLRVRLVDQYEGYGYFLAKVSAACPRLQALEVYYDGAGGPAAIFGEEWRLLARSSETLRELRLHGNVVATEITDATMGGPMCALWVDLKVLRLCFGTVSDGWLRVWGGEYCGKSLRRCEIWGSVDVEQLESSVGNVAAYAVELRELTVQGFEWPEMLDGGEEAPGMRTMVRRIVNALSQVAPKLVTLKVRERTPLDCFVEKTWRELWEAEDRIFDALPEDVCFDNVGNPVNLNIIPPPEE
ncbi:hypothetical protein EDC01DRAFT_782213 [Geopyxis carbonaria]|nr:hypothetical protein EDC01DRAFT_782213 [Geopyxis carbonaria]